MQKNAAELLAIYFEQGQVFLELGKGGQKFRYDDASVIFSNVLRVVVQGSELWWNARLAVLVALVECGQRSDLQLARVGLENLERTQPGFDNDAYGLRERFAALKERIARALERGR